VCRTTASQDAVLGDLLRRAQQSRSAQRLGLDPPRCESFVWSSHTHNGAGAHANFQNRATRSVMCVTGPDKGLTARWIQSESLGGVCSSSTRFPDEADRLVQHLVTQSFDTPKYDLPANSPFANSNIDHASHAVVCMTASRSRVWIIRRHGGYRLTMSMSREKTIYFVAPDEADRLVQHLVTQSFDTPKYDLPANSPFANLWCVERLRHKMLY
jgi:hypothetical protein